MADKYIKIKLKGYDHKLLDESAKKIIEAVKDTEARVSGPIPLPNKRTLYSVIKLFIKGLFTYTTLHLILLPNYLK